jgi:hypothetical protein
MSRVHSRRYRSSPAAGSRKIDHQRHVSVIGWCRAADLEALLPHNAEKAGRWENAVLQLNVDERLTAGLPPLV